MNGDRMMGRGARRMRGFGIGRLILVVFVLLLVFAGYVAFVLSWDYSTGERAGWVQKLSHKGFLCKTWEGELSMVSMPGAAPEKFFFTVWDDKVAADINKLMGRRVTLHYREKLGIPGSCFGETRHYVDRVEEVPEIPIAPGVSVPVPRAPLPDLPGAAQTPAPNTK